jgi:hypothetical protein
MSIIINIRNFTITKKIISDFKFNLYFHVINYLQQQQQQPRSRYFTII